MNELSDKASASPKLMLLLRLAGILTLVLAVVCAAAVGWRFAVGDRVGCAAVVVAAAGSWLGAACALVIAAWVRGPHAALAASLGGMLVRMAIPLAAALVAQRMDPSLAEAGVFGWTVLFYLVALATETLLSLRLLNLPLTPSRAA